MKQANHITDGHLFHRRAPKAARDLETDWGMTTAEIADFLKWLWHNEGWVWAGTEDLDEDGNIVLVKGVPLVAALSGDTTKSPNVYMGGCLYMKAHKRPVLNPVYEFPHVFKSWQVSVAKRRLNQNHQEAWNAYFADRGAVV